MFEIEIDGDLICLSGKLDFSQAEKAAAALAEVQDSAVVDFADLEYISSAGIGHLFATQKRLMAENKGLKLINLNPDILYVFEIAGFDTIFEIESSPPATDSEA